ncbi:hypothetical protein TNCV_1136221 [Trichonephila clavipes]|nr:hypothetical protein TNCV_1136221 [Trichonephila clavipes]
MSGVQKSSQLLIVHSGCGVLAEETTRVGKTTMRCKVTSASVDRHLLRMTVNDGTASSKQLAARWSTSTGVLMSASSTSAAPWIACKSAFIQDLPHGKLPTAASAMGS